MKHNAVSHVTPLSEEFMSKALEMFPKAKFNSELIDQAKQLFRDNKILALGLKNEEVSDSLNEDIRTDYVITLTTKKDQFKIRSL